MLFTRREVCIGKTVPEVLDTGLGRYTRQSNNILIFFLKPNKWLRKEPLEL